MQSQDGPERKASRFLAALGMTPARRSSLPNAEAAEDQVEDVVGGGGAGDLVQGTQGVVEVEEQHFVGGVGGHGVLGGGQGVERVAHQRLVAGVGEEAGLLLYAAFAADVLENLRAQLGDALAGEGGDEYRVASPESRVASPESRVASTESRGARSTLLATRTAGRPLTCASSS